MTDEYLLAVLLEQCFDTAVGLRTFLVSRILGLSGRLVDELPGAQVSLQTYAGEAASQLIRGDLVTTGFLGELMIEAAGQRAAITYYARVRRIPLAWPVSLPPPEPPPLPPSNNPFIPFRSFVGRTDELAAIVELLAVGQSVLLIGGRRTGKTALALRITAEMLGRRLVRIDAASLQRETEVDLISSLAERFQASCSDRKELLKILERYAPLCIVVDEAERLLGHPWTSSFLAWLRFLDDTGLASGLSLLLLGGPELERYRDRLMDGSPVLNTARSIHLRPLTPEARADLLAILGRPNDAVERFERELGGHPCLLTDVLFAMWNGRSLDTALQTATDACQARAHTWLRQMGEPARDLLFNRIGDGVPEQLFADVPVQGELAPYVADLRTLDCMCLVEHRNGYVHPGPALIIRALRKMHERGRT